MRRQNNIIRILILVFAVLIALLVIGGGIYLFSASKQLKSIALQPEFSETSLEVGTQYAFTISTQPSKAGIKKAKAVVDDPTCSFEINDDGQAILTTGMSEGTVTVYIECKDIKSQVLTFSIVDSVARAQAEAAAQAEEQKKAEEAAAAAAEAAAQEAKKYVKCTGDDVNVRSTNSTDGEVLGKAKKGYMFEKIEDVDDWTHIKYKDKDGYIKSEFVTEISEEEYNEGPFEEEEEKKEEEKKDEKKTEENATTEESQTQSKAEAEAKAAADAAKAAEDAAKAAEEAAKAQAELAAAAAAAQAAAGHSVTMKDGTTVTFTKSQYDYLKGIWPADTDEMISHHNSGEINALVSGH